MDGHLLVRSSSYVVGLVFGFGGMKREPFWNEPLSVLCTQREYCRIVAWVTGHHGGGSAFSAAQWPLWFGIDKECDHIVGTSEVLPNPQTNVAIRPARLGSGNCIMRIAVCKLQRLSFQVWGSELR